MMIKQLFYIIALSMLLFGLPSGTTFADQSAKAPAEAVTSAGAEKKKPKLPYAAALEGAEKIGDGIVTAYKKDDSTLIALPKDLMGRLFLWYSEAVSLPTEAVSESGIKMGANVKTGTTVVTLERHGSRVFIRDHTPGYNKRVGTDDPVFSFGTPIQVVNFLNTYG